jgi:hypothetical protein
VFVGTQGCLLVEPRQELRGRDSLLVIPGQALQPGDSLWVFDAGKPASKRAVQYLIAADSAKAIFDQRRFQGVQDDPELSRRIGCWWGLQGAAPAPVFLARYADDPTLRGEDSDDLDLPLAIKDLPSSAIVVGGRGKKMGAVQLGSLCSKLGKQLPSMFATANALQAGKSYGPVQGEWLVELCVGKPYGTHEPLDSVQCARLFLYRGKVLAMQRFSRSSTQEECADCEPPQLTRTNWSETLDETAGFISLDGAATWERLSAAATFEGVGWWVNRLAAGLPIVWNFYLYTPH